LEGATNHGLAVAFHPAGGVLASNGWEGELRLWDSVLSRHVFALASNQQPEFTGDGRIFIHGGNELTPWRVDPALEYRALAHYTNPPLDHARPSIHPGGRLLAVGTDRGVAIWDLSRGTELTYLAIGLAWHSMFELSGDLLTNGSAGVLRWPVRDDLDQREVLIGPPHRLPLPGTRCAISENRTGRIVAVANQSEASFSIADE
jgi:WD40 repeat protein